MKTPKMILAGFVCSSLMCSAGGMGSVSATGTTVVGGSLSSVVTIASTDYIQLCGLIGSTNSYKFEFSFDGGSTYYNQHANIGSIYAGPCKFRLRNEGPNGTLIQVHYIYGDKTSVAINESTTSGIDQLMMAKVVRPSSVMGHRDAVSNIPMRSYFAKMAIMNPNKEEGSSLLAVR